MFSRVLREFADAFETQKRPDGSPYVRLKDDCAGWLKAGTSYPGPMRAIHEALDGGNARLPSDWVYSETQGIVDDLVSHEIDAEDRAHSDIRNEIADGRVDVYNSARIEWLADHLFNAQLCDEAVSEGLVSAEADLFDRIRSGQFIAATRMIDAIITLIDAEANERLDEIKRGQRCPDDLSEHPSIAT